MKKYCVVQTTFKSKIEAKKIIKILLKNKLIACAQISTIDSFYLWNGEVVNEKEIAVSLKTKIDFYKKVEEVIIKNHSYEIPQIIMLPIKNASQSYLEWIEFSLKNN
jgi:periplasmic divalent cation tolerance protein